MPLEVQTLIYAADASGRHLHWQESLDNGLRAIEPAAGAENPWSHLYSRRRVAMSLIRMGDLDAARPHALVLRDLAEKRSTPRALASLGFYTITLLSCLEGDWKALRRRDAERDRTKAITLLGEFMAISSELGMRPLMERVRSRREILSA